MAESGNQPEAQRAPASNLYYCHICSANVANLAADYTCPMCHSGFVEMVENSQQNTGASSFSSRPNASSLNSSVDTESFIRMIMSPFLNQLQRQQAQQQPSTSGGRPNTAPGTVTSDNAGENLYERPQQNMPQGLQNFLQTLIQGLTNDGTFQIQLHINNGEGGANFTFPTVLHGNAADYAWGPGGLDAIVTQLLNQVEGGAPPMPKDKMDSLPEVTIRKEQVEKRLQCAVCMDDFKLDEIAVRLICEHLYHRGCIVPWLEKHNSCPVCRKSAETGQSIESPSVTYSSPFSNTFFGPTNTGPASASQEAAPDNSSTTRTRQGTDGRQSDRPQWMDIEDLD